MIDTNEIIIQQQKERVRSLLRRRGWSLHMKAYPNNRLYAAAAKREIGGKWRGVYIASVTRLSDMTDEAILRKVPNIA